MTDDSESAEESSDGEDGRGHKDGKDIDDILRTNEELVVKNGTKLSPGLLEFSTLVDANSSDPSNGTVTSVHFHQNAQLLVAAGLDQWEEERQDPKHFS